MFMWTSRRFKSKEDDRVAKELGGGEFTSVWSLNDETNIKRV